MNILLADLPLEQLPKNDKIVTLVITVLLHSFCAVPHTDSMQVENLDG